MSDDAQYKIESIFDMAKITDEAQPRFLAELPSILYFTRRMMDAHSQAAEALGFEVMKFGDGPFWVDDGLGEIRPQLICGDEILAEGRFKMGGKE